MSVILPESSTVLYSPHNDDAVLFASFLVMGVRPDVVTVLRSDLQAKRGTGITATMRELEDLAAFTALGLLSEQHICQWPYLDSAPDWDAIGRDIRRDATLYATAIAPAPYDEGGHPHHDKIGQLVHQEYGDFVTYYHTYRNGRGRVEEGNLAVIADPIWIKRKLLALACYDSQISEPSTGHHFLAGLQEWYQ